MGVVLDTSVVSKLFFNEEGTDEVMGLIDKLNEKDVVFHACDLLLYEIGKVAEKKRKNTDFGAPDYPNWVFGLELHLHFPQMPLLKLANDLSRDLDISFYDACHLAVAKKLNFPLITEDKVLQQKSDIAISVVEASENVSKLLM